MELEFFGIVIVRMSKMLLFEFVKVYLFELMGIIDYEWYIMLNGGGYVVGFFYMKLVDMFKIV